MAGAGIEAIEAAYRSHGHHVLRRARRILGDENEAHEVLQEVFMSLLDRPEQFRGRSALTTWLYSATTHRCLNRLRDAENRRRLVDQNVKPLVGSAAPASAEARVGVREVLASVPEELARVAVHYYLDEMSHEEIAGVLGCSRRHVGDLLARFQAQAVAAS